jgi:hypothetical protein
MNMSTTANIHDQPSSVGLMPVYYPARLSSEDLSALKFWAKHCRLHAPTSPLLGAYLHALHDLEVERRAILDAGDEVVDVEMPAMPTPHWTNQELAAALGKLTAMAFSTDGEIQLLFQKLSNVAIAETQWRLGLRD